MPAFTAPTLRLTHEGALTLLRAGVDKAAAMGQPQDIVIVDAGLNIVAQIRMDGARVPSMKSARAKAMTAASLGKPTGQMSADNDMKLAVATGGDLVNLPGGLPIVVDGHVIGGIGVGSGTGAQDLEVAKAALAALPEAQQF